VAAVIAAAVAVSVAGAMFADYLAHPDELWRGVYHDRNGHLAAGMNLALAVKTGDPRWFATQLLAMNGWGPVHGLVLALVFLAGGVDHRIAILPSLAGWVTTVVVGAMLARMLFVDRVLGFLAGALAATWIIASPAFRLLGSDVMLEGLGAGLSALALWTWGQARADLSNAARWRAFAIVLTVLFFEKPNYWGLVVGAIGLSELLHQQVRWQGWLTAARRSVAAWRPRWPIDLWTVACLAASALVVALFVIGPSTIAVFSRRVSLYPPDNLVTLAYALGFVRLWILWRAHRARLRERLGVAGRNLVYWHAAPLAISWLIPRRLAGLILYVGPANHVAGQGYDPLSGAALYAGGFERAFSTAPWSAWLALGLAAIAASQWLRYPIGGRVVFVFVAVSALSVVVHPLHQGRYLASWIFAVWVCAGAGGAILLGAIARRLRAGTAARAAAAGAVGLAFVALSARAPITPDALAVDGRAASGPTDLALVRPWMDLVAGQRALGVATTFGDSELFRWSLQERCQCKLDVERPWTSPGGTRLDSQRVMLATLAASKADRWVVIDAPASPNAEADVGFTYPQLAGLVDAMGLQRRYRPIAVIPLPTDDGSATVYAN
jgi:hypothetical protein